MTAARSSAPARGPEAADASMKGTFAAVLVVQGLTLTALWLFQSYFSR
jgi:hypothetical protein